MSAPTIPTVRQFRNALRNYNDCLKQEYFGQVNVWADNYYELLGAQFEGKYTSTYGTETFPVHADFVGIWLVPTDEFIQALDYPRFCDFCPPHTLRDMCGFDDETIRKFIFSFGLFNYKSVGIYIFKNLNYSK